MKISRIEATPIRIPLAKPYHWARGVTTQAETILVEVHSDTGLTGYGECIVSASPALTLATLAEAETLAVGRNVHDVSRLMNDLYLELFRARGTYSAPRFAAMALSGLDLALWDLMGRAADLPVHRLLGGCVRDSIDYFGFAQGDTPEEIAGEAEALANSGYDPIYVKVGRGDALDLEIVRNVRKAIGSRRLRIDANESWTQLQAARMSRLLEPYDLEFIEQPTTSRSLRALGTIRAANVTAIAADQSAFSAEDVFDLCAANAADVIVLGVHEAGGVVPFLKAAAVAEAAGISICLHGVYESGITTCVSNMLGSVIPNLDDGNQYMNHLLEDDIISAPSLSLEAGRLGVLQGVGFGFELDRHAVDRLRIP